MAENDSRPATADLRELVEQLPGKALAFTSTGLTLAEDAMRDLHER